MVRHLNVKNVAILTTTDTNGQILAESIRGNALIGWNYVRVATGCTISRDVRMGMNLHPKTHI
jgi:hypothetical protein